MERERERERERGSDKRMPRAVVEWIDIELACACALRKDVVQVMALSHSRSAGVS